MGDRGEEELPRALREVHDHAVHRREPREEVLARPLVDDDRLRAVPPDVLPKELDGGGVRIDRMDRSRFAGAGDQDRVRADTGEQVHDDLAGSHLLRHPQPLGPEAGREVRVLDIDEVPEAELDVLRPGLSLPRHHADSADPQLSLDPVIDRNRADLRVPAQHRIPDSPLMFAQLGGESQDDDIPDRIERLREEGREAGGHLHEVPVAPDGRGSLLEVPLHGAVLRARRCVDGDVQGGGRTLNPELLAEEPCELQLPADLLPFPERDFHGQGAHRASNGSGLFLSFHGREPTYGGP